MHITTLASLHSFPYPWNEGSQSSGSSLKSIHRHIYKYAVDLIQPTLREFPTSRIGLGSWSSEKTCEFSLGEDFRLVCVLFTHGLSQKHSLLGFPQNVVLVHVLPFFIKIDGIACCYWVI